MKKRALILLFCMICVISFFVATNYVKNSHKKTHNDYKEDDIEYNYENYIKNYTTGDAKTFGEFLEICNIADAKDIDYIIVETDENTEYYFTDENMIEAICEEFENTSYYISTFDFGADEYSYDTEYAVVFVDTDTEEALKMHLINTRSEDTEIMLPGVVKSGNVFEYIENEKMSQYDYYGCFIDGKIKQFVGDIEKMTAEITMDEINDRISKNTIPTIVDFYCYRHEFVEKSDLNSDETYYEYRMNIQDSGKYLLIKNNYAASLDDGILYTDIISIILMNEDGSEDETLYERETGEE